MRVERADPPGTRAPSPGGADRVRLTVLHHDRQGSFRTIGGLRGRIGRAKIGGIAAILRRRNRRLFARPLTLGLMLLLAIAVIGVWVRVAQTLLQPVEHAPPIGQVSGIVWGGRVFTSSGQLRTFLESRGLSYARWAKAHPYAFSGGPPPTATTQVAVAKRTKEAIPTTASSTKTTSSSERQAASQVGDGVGTQRLVTLLLIAAAATLALVGTIAVPALLTLTRGLEIDPDRRLAVFARALYVDPERRLALFAAGLAILAGLVIAYFLV